MSEINLIDKPEDKSVPRKITELGVTTAIWGLWLYMLLPIINILLWIVGLSTISTELFEKGGYLVFIELVQQMGLVILVTFSVMRLWGIYNYYRFGRRNRRNHEMPDSIEKMSRFYQLEPQELLHLKTREEIIWPHKSDNEDAGAWLQKKAANLSEEQLREDEGNIIMRFHDVSGKGIPSITGATLISIVFIIILAGTILFAVGGFQKKSEVATADMQVSQTVPASNSQTTKP